MTLYFTGTVEAMLAGREVRMSLGVWFDFASQEMRVLPGRGSFRDDAGNLWQGIGQLAQISGLQGSSMLSTEPVTMALPGIDSGLMDLARSQADEIRGRTCGVYFLFFDANWQLIDSPYLSELYLMDKATFAVDGESRTMSITLSAEPLFFSKHVPPVSFLSDADQQRKYPGDTVMQRIPLLKGRQSVYWLWS